MCGLASNITSAYELSNAPIHKLSTGCPVLDRCLNGGLSTAGITEIAGESGCGKTQICLQLALTVQYSVDEGGLNGGAVYICTEDGFPTRRLQELVTHFPQKYYKAKDECVKQNFGDNVFIEHIADFECLVECLTKRIIVLMNRKSIKLLIIDSMAGLFRSTYANNEGRNRAMDLRRIGHILHKLSFCNNLCVVCVNQATSVVSDGRTTLPVPALGLAWANMVTTRLQVYKGLNSRTLKIVYAPDLAKEEIFLTVKKEGVSCSDSRA